MAVTKGTFNLASNVLLFTKNLRAVLLVSLRSVKGQDYRGRL